MTLGKRSPRSKPGSTALGDPTTRGPLEPDTASRLLGEVFGRTTFRPFQREAVEAFLHGRDALVVLPTGAGKSLCFQLPAVALARDSMGPTLVVSPLLALMDDQVEALRARGVRAVALHSGVPWAEQQAALQDLAGWELLYVSPERLANARFRTVLGRVRLARAVVDEAHCISEWGHDFRPDYALLGLLKRELGLPTMALTATATRAVQEDIVASLGLETPARIVGSFIRPNLSYGVELSSGSGQTRTDWAVETLRAHHFAERKPSGRAIVYASTRKRAQEVQRALRQAGIRAGYYHAGRKSSARERAHASFAAGKTPVLVATSAFGMGVDIPDVRLVLHVQAPTTLESYAQQAGRAGRDGEAAACLLAFSEADLVAARRLLGASASHGMLAGLSQLRDYAHASECRQRFIARHFGDEAAAPCGRCDVCRDPEQVARATEAFTRERRLRAKKREPVKRARGEALTESQLEWVVAFVDALQKPVGRRSIVKALRGSRARDVLKKGLAKNPHFGALRELTEEVLFEALSSLVERGLLVPKGKKYPTLWVAGKAVRPPRAREPRAAPRPEAKLEAELKRYRRAEAKQRRLKPYQIFPNRTLSELCKKRPSTEAELGQIWGFGEQRIRAHGAAVLSLLVTHSGG